MIASRLRRPLLLALLILLLLAPTFSNPYYETVLINAAVGVILTVGFRIIFVAGRFTLGQAGFLGIGAYTSALLVTKLGVNFWFGLILGGVAAAVVAIAFGYIALRLSGIYFVIMTLALSEGLRHFYVWAAPLTGGITGVLNVPAPIIDLPGLPRFDFGVDPAPFYYLILAITLVSIAVMHRMEDSRIGMVFHCVRQNPVLAEHLGMNLARYRVLAWSTACFFAGMAGSFQAHYWRYVSPDDFTLMPSIYVQVYGIVGGLGSIAGSIVGPAFVVILSEGLRVAKEVQPIIYGSLLLVTALLLPGGLISLPTLARSGIGKIKLRLVLVKSTVASRDRSPPATGGRKRT